jgi:hypothetical protein
MMIAFFQFIHKIRKQRAHYYYSRLISTPALVSPSSLLMMILILMLMLMMMLLGLRYSSSSYSRQFQRPQPP